MFLHPRTNPTQTWTNRNPDHLLPKTDKDHDESIKWYKANNYLDQKEYKIGKRHYQLSPLPTPATYRQFPYESEDVESLKLWRPELKYDKFEVKREKRHYNLFNPRSAYVSP
jgi:hypothetical protein